MLLDAMHHHHSKPKLHFNASTVSSIRRTHSLALLLALRLRLRLTQAQAQAQVSASAVELTKRQKCGATCMGIVSSTRNGIRIGTGSGINGLLYCEKHGLTCVFVSSSLALITILIPTPILTILYIIIITNLLQSR